MRPCITITSEQADEIDRRIRTGYHEIARKNRLGYPPYQLTSWDDRAAYHAYVVRVLQDMVDRPAVPGLRLRGPASEEGPAHGWA